MKIGMKMVLAMALTLGACAPQTSAPANEGRGAPAPSTIAAFDPAAGELPEGLVLKDGFAYVGFAPLGQIARVDLRSGQTSRGFASLPKPVPGKGFMTGLAFGPDGALYAALVSFDPSVQPGVYRVASSGGGATLFAKHAQMVFPNGLLFNDRGELFVTDSAAGAVFKASPAGTTTAWATSPLLGGDASACGGSGNPFAIGANGLVALGGSVFVTNTDRGSILRIAIKSDGSAAAPEVAVGPDCSALSGADGLMVDGAGDFVVAINRQNKLVRVSPSGGPIAVVTSGAPVDFPASTAWNGTTMTWTNFAFANASTGKPAKPGLLAIAQAQ